MKRTLKLKTLLTLVAVLCMTLLIGTLTFKPTKADGIGVFQMVDSVSIRLDDNGLRFKAKMDETTYNTLDENNKLFFIIMPAKYLPVVDGEYSTAIERNVDGTVNEESSHCLYVSVAKDKIYFEDDTYYANAGVSPVNENNYGLDFVAIATIEHFDGENYSYTYADPASDEMPIVSQYDAVKKAFLSDDDYLSEIKSEYGWFGTDAKYPVNIESDAEYTSLVTKINGDADFEGLNIYIASTVDKTVAKLDEGKSLPETVKWIIDLDYVMANGGKFTISDKESDVVTMGDSLSTLTANLSYNEENIDINVEWSSSDESVATVDNGAITLQGVGRSVISAKIVANDSYLFENDIVAEYEIFVKPNVSFEGKNARVRTADDGRYLSATATYQDGVGFWLKFDALSDNVITDSSVALENSTSFEIKFNDNAVAYVGVNKYSDDETKYVNVSKHVMWTESEEERYHTQMICLIAEDDVLETKDFYVLNYVYFRTYDSNGDLETASISASNGIWSMSKNNVDKDGMYQNQTPTLSDNSLSMVIGDTKTLTVSGVNVQEKVKFTSSNENVATVDEDGVVTAIADGVSTITANYFGNTAICSIIVGDIFEGYYTETLNEYKGGDRKLVATGYYEKDVGLWVKMDAVHKELNQTSNNGTVTTRTYFKVSLRNSGKTTDFKSVSSTISNFGGKISQSANGGFDLTQSTIWTKRVNSSETAVYETHLIGFISESYIRDTAKITSGRNWFEITFEFKTMDESGTAESVVFDESNKGKTSWSLARLMGEDGIFEAGENELSIMFKNTNEKRNFIWSAKLNKYGMYIVGNALTNLETEKVYVQFFKDYNTADSSSGFVSKSYADTNTTSLININKSVINVASSATSSLGYKLHTEYRMFLTWNYLTSSDYIGLPTEKSDDNPIYINTENYLESEIYANIYLKANSSEVLGVRYFACTSGTSATRPEPYTPYITSGDTNSSNFRLMTQDKGAQKENFAYRFQKIDKDGISLMFSLDPPYAKIDSES